jgi:hypothetical protein
MAENEGLRREMQRLREKYEGEIGQLKRNITLKDELLDECEKEIGNLKGTYLKLITQYD